MSLYTSIDFFPVRSLSPRSLKIFNESVSWIYCFRLFIVLYLFNFDSNVYLKNPCIIRISFDVCLTPCVRFTSSLVIELLSNDSYNSSNLFCSRVLFGIFVSMFCVLQQSKPHNILVCFLFIFAFEQKADSPPKFLNNE